MNKLSRIIANLIIQIYLRPRKKILNELDIILENELKGNIGKILLLLVSILLCIIIIPLSIIYTEYGLIKKLKWSSLYLLLFGSIALIISAYYDALSKFKETYNSNLDIGINDALHNFAFRIGANHKNLSENLILKNAFRCEVEDLIKVFSCQVPSNKIAVTYVGANGRVSYHNLFFTFDYILQNGIANLSHEKRKKLLIYISRCFKKNNQQINLKTLNQNYIDWMKQKYNERNVNEYLKEFATPIQSV